MKQITSLSLSVLLLSLLAGCAALSGKSNSADNSLHTYSNYQYGFELDRPGFIEVFDGAEVTSNVAKLSYIPVCDIDTSIACFYLDSTRYANSNFNGAGLSVNLISDNGSLNQCAILYPDSPDSPRLTDQTTINDVLYFYGNTSNAALGHQAEETVYRTVQDSKCIEVKLRILTSTYENYPEGSITLFSEEQYAAVQAILDQMLSSIRFTR